METLLKELVTPIKAKIEENRNTESDNKRKITFVKAGERCMKQTVQSDSFLSAAKDWKLSVDLKDRVRIPPSVCITDMRPDIIIVSAATRQMAIVELTVPTEERIEIAGESKRLKYEKIVHEGKQNGWRVRCWAVEVGCRGFPAVSMSGFLKDLGYTGRERRKIVERLGSLAESASRSLWKASHYKEWGGK